MDAGEVFADIFEPLDSIGATYIEASMLWDEIETSAGIYTHTASDAANLNNFLPQAGWRASLAVNAIDTNQDRRPAWLRSLEWNDPTLVDAYWALLQNALAQFPDAHIDGIAIGNEVDVYLRAHPQAQAHYIDFVRQIQQRLRSEYPTLRTGVKTTVAGALRHSPDLVRQLNETTDVIMATYYAIDENIQALPTDTAIAELESFLDAFPGREVQMIELGAMSSDQCGSSNRQQAEFIQESFQFWDRHADQVSLINYLWLSDLSDSLVDDFVQYYGVPIPCFREYLATLGVRDNSGQDKGGFQVLQQEATARGF